MAERMVLSEDEAIELLAFLLTASRTQVDEPPDYGPQRLLTAAEKLSAMMMERASEETREMLEGYVYEIPRVHRLATDRDRYIQVLDELCRTIARHLVARAGLASGAS